MKTRLQVISITLLLWIMGIVNIAQAALNLYYSQGNLPANQFSSWNTNPSGGGSTPTSWGAHFTIQSGHTMTTNGSWSIPSGNLTINSGGSLTLSNDLSTNGSYTFTVNGSLDCGTNIVSGTAGFTIASGGALKIGSVDGITTGTTASGNIQVTGTRIYNTGANYYYIGSSAQVTGNGLPSSLSNLTINNSTGVTLSGSTTVTSTLTLTSGNLNTSSYTLSLGSSATVNGETSGRYIVGTVSTQRTVGSGTGLADFGLGVNLSSGVDDLGTINFTRVSGTAGIVTISGKSGIARKWQISISGTVANYDRNMTVTWISDDDNGKTLTSGCRYYSTDAGSTWHKDGSTSDLSSRSVTVVFGGNGSLTISDDANPLPVELTGFTVSMAGDAALLKWSTATEVNNYGFEVERRKIQKSESRSQELGWKKVGFVNGAGTSNSPHEYSYTDASVASGTYAYRLKQIDNGGMFKYSQETEVIIAAPKEFALSQNYPNPFNPTTVISYQLPVTSNANLIIYDMLGREVATLVNEKKDAGNHEVKFDASGMSSGVYFYRMQAGEFVQTKKLVLLR